MGNVDQLVPPAPRFVRSADLRAAMGHFATGVAVVTASDREGRPFGTTANAISSLSLDPPLVLACLRRESETLSALRATGRFAVNVLGAGQRELSDRFARRTAPDSWAGVAHRLPDGVPVLDGALATVECSLHEIADGGDHVIVIGRVVAVGHPDDHVEPLLFYRGAYAALGEGEGSGHASAQQGASAGVEASAVVERVAAAESDALAEASASVGQNPGAGRGAEKLGVLVEPGGEEASPEIALPSALGALRMVALHDGGTVEASVAVLVGEPHGSRGALVHVHRGCLLGDALGSQVCRGRERLHGVLREIADAGRAGVIVYHRDGARGFGGCCLDADGDHGEPPLNRAERAAVEEAIVRLDLREPEVVA